jgi:hypothetical protein
MFVSSHEKKYRTSRAEDLDAGVHIIFLKGPRTEAFRQLKIRGSQPPVFTPPSPQPGQVFHICIRTHMHFHGSYLLQHVLLYRRGKRNNAFRVLHPLFRLSLCLIQGCAIHARHGPYDPYSTWLHNGPLAVRSFEIAPRSPVARVAYECGKSELRCFCFDIRRGFVVFEWLLLLFSFVMLLGMCGGQVRMVEVGIAWPRHRLHSDEGRLGNHR